MAKLVFPSVSAPYRGFAGEVRGWLGRIASYHDRSPGAAATLLAQISVLVQKLGGAAVRTVGSAVPLLAYNGAAYTPARTGTLANNGSVVLPSTALPLISGTKVTAPAATGTYVNGYTFTIVNGAITAVVAS